VVVVEADLLMVAGKKYSLELDLVLEEFFLSTLTSIMCTIPIIWKYTLFGV
jgi:hypothetical protein